LEKYARQIGSFPQVWMKIKKKLPPPRKKYSRSTKMLQHLGSPSLGGSSQVVNG